MIKLKVPFLFTKCVYHNNWSFTDSCTDSTDTSPVGISSRGWYVMLQILATWDVRWLRSYFSGWWRTVHGWEFQTGADYTSIRRNYASRHPEEVADGLCRRLSTLCASKNFPFPPLPPQAVRSLRLEFLRFRGNYWGGSILCYAILCYAMCTGCYILRC